MSQTFTVGELRACLSVYNDDFELKFDGGLSFYRIKTRGQNIAVLEFNEVQASLSSRFKKKFPEVKVAFCAFDSDGSFLQTVNVPEL
ncbi:MAG: hypothetical protein O9286_14995 [Aquidulcibacter sp.]|jgi:hypothetical protein|uniref:hypothetical protein n=1 Tax=Aquidulcibacter sp. TaxID=2052990 RepID=UPI0022C175E9|nr:hypothetical protein [Aquidulcibacter sp.]